MSPTLKLNYAVEEKYGAFYTGGRVQLSSDGAFLFCQCETAVKIVTVATGKVYKTIEEEEDVVTNFILSPDDQVLVVAYKSLVLRQWDWRESVVMRKWKAIHIAPITCMGFDVTSTLLATGSADSTVKVWDVVRKYCTHNLRQHTGVVSVSEFHPDIKRLLLVTASSDYKIRVWTLHNSKGTVLEGHYSVITKVQFSADGDTMYSAGRDRVVIIWSLKNLTRLKTIPVYESLEGLLLLPSERHLPELNVKTNDPHFITAGEKGVLRVWNAASVQCVYQQQDCLADNQPADETQTDQKRKVTEITDLSYNKTLDMITTVTYDHNILMYNSTDLSLEKQFAGYSDEVTDVKYVNDTYIAMATNSELLKVMNLETGVVQLLKGHKQLIMCLSVADHGSLISSGDKDGTVLLWYLDPETGKVRLVGEGEGHTNAIGGVSFSHLKSSFIATGSHDLTLKLWHLPSDVTAEDKVKLKALVTERGHDKDINSVVVSPNDKLVASASQDKTVKVWSADSLDLLGVCRGHSRGIWCVKFSPVDQCLATASADGTIKIWALSNYTCVKTFEGHSASVLNLSFISRGMQIVSSGSDGLVKLWTLKTNECVKTLDEHEDKVWALACNSTEDRLISGAADSLIIVWKDVTETEYEEARTKQEEIILKEQEIQNLLQQKKYLKALRLAINLDQPFRVFNIIKGIMTDHEGNTTDLDATLMRLKDYQIDAVLRYAVTWNTNSKNCHVAQHVITTILRTHTFEDLMKLQNFKSSLEGLIPYTERHIQRMNRLQQQSTFIDYTWQSMRLVAGESFENDEDVSRFDINEPLGMNSLLSIKRTSTQSETSSESSSDSEMEEPISTSVIREKPADHTDSDGQSDSQDSSGDDQSDSQESSSEDDAQMKQNSETDENQIEGKTKLRARKRTKIIEKSLNDESQSTHDNESTDSSDVEDSADERINTRLQASDKENSAVTAVVTYTALKNNNSKTKIQQQKLARSPVLKFSEETLKRKIKTKTKSPRKKAQKLERVVSDMPSGGKKKVQMSEVTKEIATKKEKLETDSTPRRKSPKRGMKKLKQAAESKRRASAVK